MASLTAARAAELLYDDEESRAVGVLRGRIISCPLEEATEMKRNFDEEMYRMADILS